MSENIETPEGWERRGPCFTRVHDGKFAVLQPHPHRDRFRARVYEAGAYEVSTESALPLPEAVAWANEQIGVPKPVEVVEIECENGALFHSSDRKRFALMHGSPNGRWYVSGVGIAAGFCDHDEALIAARAYVRGDA